MFSAAGQRAHDVTGLSPVAIGNRVLKGLGGLVFGFLVCHGFLLLVNCSSQVKLGKKI